MGLSKQFWLICGVTFFYFASFNMIIPRLSPFLTELGGEVYLKYVISLFAFSALLTRPFSGKLVDIWGRKPIIFVGILISVVVGAMYAFTTTVLFFLLLRLIHGVSAGCTPTGTTTLCSDVVPIDRRGEAMGYVGMASNIGMSIGPAVGSEVAFRASDQAVFLSSAGIGLLTLIFAYFLQERIETKPFRPSMLLVKFNEIIERQVIYQGVIMLLTCITFGAILTLIPDYLSSYGIVKTGYFFTVMTIVSIVVRFLTRKTSDKYGRAVVMLAGCIVLVAANVLLVTASNGFGLFVGGAVFGFSTGLTAPTIFAWVVDDSNPKAIGRGISTLFIFLELGIIAGSYIPTELYLAYNGNFKVAFIFSGICAVLASMSLAKRVISLRRAL